MIDEHAADDLKIYIDNDAALYRQRTAIYKNLATKKVRSEYAHAAAVKAFGPLVEIGAKKYAKEWGGTWHHVFNVPTRKAVAEEMTQHFETEFSLGNYDYLLPKKYQAEMLGTGGKKIFPRSHSTRKSVSASDLFMGIYPTGISYADRSRERDGDYLKLAHLPYSTLELKWYEPEAKVPPALRAAILADARRMIAQRGKEFKVSTAGQTVLLGGGKKAHSTVKGFRSRGRQLDDDIANALSGRRGRR